jgi:hypothetical protein
MGLSGLLHGGREMMERMAGLELNRMTWRCFLFLGILVTAAACLPPQEQNTSVSERTDVGDGSNLAQWRKDNSEMHRLCFVGAGGARIILDRKKYHCSGFLGVQPTVHSSWPNLSATVRGQCDYPKDTRIAGVCEIKDGRIVSVKHYKGGYLDPEKKCLQGLRQYRLPDKAWAHERSLIFDYGFEERNLPKDHEYILSGIIKWKIYDPVKSRLEKPPLYYVVGEEMERFECKVKNGVVQGYRFSEVGPLTWDERGKMEEFKFYQ